MGAANPESPPGKSKARIADYEELSSQEFQKRQTKPTKSTFRRAQRLGELVIGAKSLPKRYGDQCSSKI